MRGRATRHTMRPREPTAWAAETDGGAKYGAADGPPFSLVGVRMTQPPWKAASDVLQIEKTYGHLLPDAIEGGRGALDAFDARKTPNAVVDRL